MHSQYTQRLRRVLTVLTAGLALLGIGVVVSFQASLLSFLFFGTGAYIVLYETGRLLDVLRLGGTGSLRQFFYREMPVLVRNIDEDLRGRRPPDVLAATIASVAVHFAKLDGRISEDEMRALRAALSRTFREGLDHEVVKRVIEHTKARLAGSGTKEIQRSAVEVIEFFRKTVSASRSFRVRLQSEELFRFLLLAVFETIIGDGAPHPIPERAFDRVAAYYRIDSESVQIIKRTAYFNLWESKQGHSRNAEPTEKTHKESRHRSDQQSAAAKRDEGDEFLAMLNLKQGATRAEMDRAWKKVVLLLHPDRFHRSSPEVYKQAHERFVTLQAAYGRLRRSAAE